MVENPGYRNGGFPSFGEVKVKKRPRSSDLLALEKNNKHKTFLTWNSNYSCVMVTCE